MNFTKTIFAMAMGSVGLMGVMSAHAVAVNTGDKLGLTAGVVSYDAYGSPGVSSGSWFAMDADNNAKIAGSEKVALSEGTTGLIIGTTTSPGASHSGLPTAGDTNEIDAPWAFFGNTGSDYVTVAVTGDTTTGLNMSGWIVTWNGVPVIPMGSGAWTPLNAGEVGMAAGPYTDGVGKFSWNGVYGSTYTLYYTATVPNGDPSGMSGVRYALHLTGMVTEGANAPLPVPEASTYGMMLAGLGLLGLAARRRIHA